MTIPNQYFITMLDKSGYHLNDLFLNSMTENVPTIDRPVITLPGENVATLIQNLTKILATKKNYRYYLGVNNNHGSIQISNLITKNPLYSDYFVIDDFIMMNHEQIKLLLEKLNQVGAENETI